MAAGGCPGGFVFGVGVGWGFGVGKGEVSLGERWLGMVAGAAVTWAGLIVHDYRYPSKRRSRWFLRRRCGFHQH